MTASLQKPTVPRPKSVLQFLQSGTPKNRGAFQKEGGFPRQEKAALQFRMNW